VDTNQSDVNTENYKRNTGFQYNAQQPIMEKQRQAKTSVRNKMGPNSSNRASETPQVGNKIILKKINHFHDEKRIDQSYG